MELDQRQTLILAILVLLLGKYLGSKIKILDIYDIPDPVTGGIIVAVLLTIVYIVFDIEISFDLGLRDMLLVVFFTSIGLSSKLSLLLQGGKALFIMLASAIGILFLQNITGISVAALTGLDTHVGLIRGSIALSGGHGTAIAWAETFKNSYGINNAMEIGIACATLGLVLGGILGGPIANFLLKKYEIKRKISWRLSVGVSNEKEENITVDSVYMSLLILALAIGLGLHLHTMLEYVGIQLPLFVPCLFGGILLTNTIPYMWKSLPWPSDKPALAMISDISLGLFLSMSLMSIQLWTLIDLALPILLIVIAQVVVISFFTVMVVFRVLGKNYDSVVMAAGLIGLALVPLRQ
ncbi:MAG: sodium/glutamate symporter [Reichenbachiella sp.]